MSALPGIFIVIEGPNGAGKTTLLAELRQALEARSLPAVFTREPGGTPFGEVLREQLLTQPLTDFTRALAMNSARAQHVNDVVEPAVKAGRVVICDRYIPSTEVYQEFLGSISGDQAECLRQVHEQMHAPDLTVFLLPSVATLSQRRAARAAQTTDVDVLEKSAQRELDAYRKAVSVARGRNWKVLTIDATSSASEIASLVLASVNLEKRSFFELQSAGRR